MNGNFSVNYSFLCFYARLPSPILVYMLVLHHEQLPCNASSLLIITTTTAIIITIIMTCIMMNMTFFEGPESSDSQFMFINIHWFCLFISYLLLFPVFRSLCASLVLLVLCLVFLVLRSPFLFYFESCASVYSVLLPPGLISSHYCELCSLPVCRFLTSLCVIYSVRLPLSDCLFSPVCHPPCFILHFLLKVSMS